MIVMKKWKFYTIEDYEITKEGQIINRHNGHKIKPQPNGKGYLRVCIGKKLFFVAKNILNRQGYKNIIVTCIVENPANEFYKKIGGKKKETIKSNIYGIQMYENLIKFDN